VWKRNTGLRSLRPAVAENDSSLVAVTSGSFWRRDPAAALRGLMKCGHQPGLPLFSASKARTVMKISPPPRGPSGAPGPALGTAIWSSRFGHVSPTSPSPLVAALVSLPPRTAVPWPGHHLQLAVEKRPRRRYSAPSLAPSEQLLIARSCRATSSGPVPHLAKSPTAPHHCCRRASVTSSGCASLMMGKLSDQFVYSASVISGCRVRNNAGCGVRSVRAALLPLGGVVGHRHKATHAQGRLIRRRRH